MVSARGKTHFLAVWRKFFFFLCLIRLSLNTNRDFELPLPGDLPASVHHDLGQVYYRLKAVAERPTFSTNYVAHRNVTVTRMMLPSSLDLNQSVVISNEWIDKISYNISVPRKVFSAGSKIPITFDLVPIAPELGIRSVSCALKEYISLSSNEHSKSDGHVVKSIRDDHFAAGNRWIKTEVLDVPSIAEVRSDIVSDLIKIKHKLKFTVALTNADGHVSGKKIYSLERVMQILNYFCFL